MSLNSLKKLFTTWPGEIFVLLAGAALVLSFAPFEIFPLGVISPAILLVCWLNVSVKRAFWRGFLFGFGFFGTGVSWVFISIHQFGNAPPWLAALVTFLFVSILALFPACNGSLLNRFFPTSSTRNLLCIFPALWVLFEWIRSWIFTGFPWLYLGYSQMDSPLRGYAPLFSVYGVSLAVLFSSGLFVSALIALKKDKVKNAYLYIFALALIWALGGALNVITWTTPLGKPIQTSLIQGNIPQEIKWVPEHTRSTLALYKTLTQQNWNSQLIIWPEAAVPLIQQEADSFLSGINNLALQHHTTIITGIPIKAPFKPGYYNAVIAIGDGNGVYIKSHLVPFGEFTPYERYIGKLFTFFDIPMSEMVSESTLSAPITIGDNIKIATYICYEIAFPEEIYMRSGNTNIILTVTDDAWFGHSIAQAQHLQMARMRALEMGRPVLFVSNNGITAFITPTGKVQSSAPPYQQFVLTDTVQPMQGKTFWARHGMDPILLIIILMLLVGNALKQMKRKVKN